MSSYLKYPVALLGFWELVHLKPAPLKQVDGGMHHVWSLALGSGKNILVLLWLTSITWETDQWLCTPASSNLYPRTLFINLHVYTGTFCSCHVTLYVPLTAPCPHGYLAFSGFSFKVLAITSTLFSIFFTVHTLNIWCVRWESITSNQCKPSCHDLPSQD